MLKIKAVLNWDVIKTSFADCLKLNFSLIFKSFLTDLVPSISQANLVIFNFSSGSSTSDILNLASVAAYSASVIDYNKKN